MGVRALTIAALACAAAVPVTPAIAARRSPALHAFNSCGALLGYARTHGQRAVRTGWLPVPMTPAAQPPTRVPAGAGPTAPQAAADQTGAGGPGTSFSTTNNQEPGVDEPDVVKTDGRFIYAVANGWLHAIDTTGDAPKVLDALKLDDGYGQQLLLHGDRLLVLQTAWLDAPAATGRQAPGAGVISGPIAFGRPVTRLTEIDVSDPAHLRVVATERDDGEYVTARLAGDTARVVLASRAQAMYAVAQASAPSHTRLLARRVRAVRRATLAAWRPHTYFHKGRRARFGPLVRCGAVRRPVRFSGLDTVTILTVDMAHGLPSVDASAIMSDADVVYGSPTRLYVATHRWLAPAVTERADAPPVTTQIDEFDTSPPDRTPYVASGTVTGFLLNQYAMSERNGVLRVASTEQPDWWPGGTQQAGAGSAVTTLDERTLAPLGRVGGLGRGQRIYAVRFIADTAYVVTFRQVDPLYTVDLSDPAAPAVRGQLELEGYSAYLHPAGDGLLLGVGQSVGGGNEPSGTQLSLFDVSDPAHPALLASHAVGDQSTSAAEYDPHAFLYWPQTGLAVLPVELYGADQPFVGAIGFRIGRAGISEVGRIAHPHDSQSLWPVQRATVIGDRVFTLSDAGMLSSALSDLAAGPFAAFADVPNDAGYGCGGVQPAQACPQPLR
ncbi:MAG: hypothetical protein QOF12_1105 [Solirubrobacteraceae bacterium]|nr:hypothetical protein [Solirubrobacteraceae bacterium]